MKFNGFGFSVTCVTENNWAGVHKMPTYLLKRLIAKACTKKTICLGHDKGENIKILSIYMITFLFFYRLHILTAVVLGCSEPVLKVSGCMGKDS